MRAVVRLDHHLELPDQLLVRNHKGPASIANLYAIRTWIDDGPEPDWSEYNFTDDPALHGAPYYHPVGNPPTQLPRENLVSTVLEWENVVHTPPLRPVHTRQATPYPVRALLALPWYGIGGVPPLEEMEGGVESVPVCGMATLTLGAPAVEYVEGHTELGEEHESRARSVVLGAREPRTVPRRCGGACA
jgi:hypothetical protein